MPPLLCVMLKHCWWPGFKALSQSQQASIALDDRRAVIRENMHFSNIHTDITLFSNSDI
jgi:hypothetical protein